MLMRPLRPLRGFMLVFVMTATVLLGLLTMAAFHLVLDHRRRTSLSIDHALAMRAAEAALAAAECELSAATATPASPACTAAPSPGRIDALDPGTLAGFVAGACGSGPARGLCRPLPGQSLWTDSRLLDTTTDGVEIEILLQTASGKPDAAPATSSNPSPMHCRATGYARTRLRYRTCSGSPRRASAATRRSRSCCRPSSAPGCRSHDATTDGLRMALRNATRHGPSGRERSPCRPTADALPCGPRGRCLERAPARVAVPASA